MVIYLHTGVNEKKIRNVWKLNIFDDVTAITVTRVICIFTAIVRRLF